MDTDQKKITPVDSNDVPQQSKKESYGEIFRFAFIILIIFLPIRLFIAKPFVVSGSSMDPTFKNGQYLIVDTVSYDFHKPQRDDVIVFKYPGDPLQKTYYIKRIIGLPGETIESRNGQIIIINNANPKGIDLNEPYVINHSAGGDDFTTVLGENDYFVMGDNRPASSDSRFWGPLKDSYIVGRPFLRLLPPTALSVLPGSYDKNQSI